MPLWNAVPIGKGTGMTSTKTKAVSGKRYRAVIGMDSPTDRYEAGADVPASVIEGSPWLLEEGVVEEVKEAQAAAEGREE